MTDESRKNLTPDELVEELKARGMSSNDILNALLSAPITHTLESKVSEILHNLGVPAHIKGYRYVRRAIIIARDNPDISMTKELYPSLAKEFQTTPQRVERAIRHAIELAWTRGDANIMNSIFGYTVSCEKGKPTNSEFIAMIADKLQLEGK